MPCIYEFKMTTSSHTEWVKTNLLQPKAQENSLAGWQGSATPESSNEPRGESY